MNRTSEASSCLARPPAFTRAACTHGREQKISGKHRLNEKRDLRALADGKRARGSGILL
jgi:hypothetical protein